MRYNSALQTIFSPVTALLGIWLAYLALLGLLQYLNLPFGFAVWPMGEDRTWLGFMLDAPGVKMVRVFWEQDGRNPLSAWWWLMTSPLIKHVDVGLYAIRKCVDPLLAIITFLLLDRLGRERYRTFAFCVALTVLMWNFSAYYEQILWDFLLALGFALAAVLFYCRFLDNARRTPYDFALALFCYLIAIATYTLQAGVIIAITLLAFFRSKQSRWQAVMDVAFFAAFLLTYCCIWYTVNGHGGAFYHFSWALWLRQLLVSISALLFHPYLSMLWQQLFADATVTTLIVAALAACITFAALLFCSPVKRWQTSAAWPQGFVVVLLIAIATPIVALESLSMTWPAGSRSVMIQQVFQPLLYVSLLFAIAQCLPLRAVLQRNTAVFLVVLLNVLVAMMNLDYNHRLVLRTQYQKTLARGLQILMPPSRTSVIYLVKLSDVNNRDLNTYPPTVLRYGQTMLQRSDVMLRVLTTDRLPHPSLAPFWTVGFAVDASGVRNAMPIDFHAAKQQQHPLMSPYRDVRIVFFDGKKVWLPDKVDKADFTGLAVAWERSTPIYQNGQVY